MTLPEEIRLEASQPRRLFALAVLTGLALLLLILALDQPLPLVWRGAFLVIAALVLWIDLKMVEAGRGHLVWTGQSLVDHRGEVVAAAEQIVSVSRGTFAFKPSNGFVLRLRSPASRAWRPGLWWRFGRRIGVGGITAAAPARLMAEAIEARVAAGRAA